MAVRQSIQRGSIAVTSGSGATVNQTITAVVMAQAVVTFTFRSENSVESRVKRESWTCQLTSTTNIQFTRFESSFAKNGTIEWEVVEWDTPTVHRGSASPVAQTSAHNIGATINVSSSIPIVYLKTDQNGYFANVVCRATLSSTQITFHFESTPGAGDADIEWQIVEFDSGDASVQTGTIALTTGTASNTATITSVDTAKTFVAMGGISTTNSTGGEHRNNATLELTNATTVTATKTVIGSGATLNVQFYAVEMLDGTTVDQGVATIADTASTPSPQPSFTAQSGPSIFNCHYLQNDRNTSGTDQFIGDNYVTIVPNGTSDGVVIQRDGTDGELKVGWYSIDWNAGGGGPTTTPKTLTHSATGTATLTTAAEIKQTLSHAGTAASTIIKEAGKLLSFNSIGTSAIIKEAQITKAATATGAATQSEALALPVSATSTSTGAATGSQSLILFVGSSTIKFVGGLVRDIVKNIVKLIGG